jgi:hypothetical protein
MDHLDVGGEQVGEQRTPLRGVCSCLFASNTSERLFSSLFSVRGRCSPVCRWPGHGLAYFGGSEFAARHKVSLSAESHSHALSSGAQNLRTIAAVRSATGSGERQAAMLG